MIVRESPKSGVKNPPPNWPPKSPHEALLSSPSGRRKFEQRRERSSVSPSPIKRRPARGHDNEEDEDEEEDEEELELKLQAIKAKLKLKKLQKARQATENDNAQLYSRPSTSTGIHRVELPHPQSAIQVPASPTRIRREPVEQTSPARVILGIDKGLRAQDVSLKRAASYSSRGNYAGGSRSTSRNDSHRSGDTPQIKSFSDRIAESRNKEKERGEKQARIESSRSLGFGLRDTLGDGASSRTGSSLSSRTQTSQDEPHRRDNLAQKRSNTSLQDKVTPQPSSTLHSQTGSGGIARTPSRFSATVSKTTESTASSKSTSKYAEISERDNSIEARSFEPFSGLHLTTRTMQHNAVTRALENKTVLTIPQILKTVKAPDFDPPDMENDFVVIGVIASKSSPLTPKNARREQTTADQEQDANKTGKFMVIRLTDLKWELDLFLFDTGFSQFWKLPLGTLIAVLNPDIMPPRQRDTGKFSLKLASSDDTVLEIGNARDLDFCHAKKKDGKDCGQWIDGRKTEFCDFHIELQVEKSKKGRMEVNTMTGFGKGPAGGKFGMFGGALRGGASKGDEPKREGKFHDRSLHETMYIAPSAGAAARLMDDESTGFERGASRAERHRKQLAEKEKERELAKMLGQTGYGAGGDYMKVKGSDTPILPTRGVAYLNESAPTSEDSIGMRTDPLGLLSKKADDVSLAPVKRKRIISGKSNTSSEPVGWGGAFKRGILLPPEKEHDASSRSTRETSPVKKRARLLLPEKGIREPGRDSLGTMDVGLLAAMDEDDDDLDIV